ncbi:hypothetical protein CN692_25535 [Bacillus sp. AFS002410]|uniref:hypothetical protein n=1 Tax=Bacillus sp. AFS002410 TaxID=2033481 RepID=UPI000BF08E20|nr:hypothetical protein [Bacillus sp. AFS002410]PEJ46667.1 hypothetical protein CN692_25535 [Bacillus sp. AFS002410]
MNNKLRNRLIWGNINNLIWIAFSFLSYQNNIANALYAIKDNNATIKGISQNLFSTNIITTQGTQTITNLPWVFTFLTIFFNFFILLTSMINRKALKKGTYNVVANEKV